MHSSQPRIIVADKDPAGRRTLTRLLEASGYVSVCASSGTDVIWQFYSSSPDALILDVNLPDMDGFEVCQYLRHNIGARETTVIFVSAVADEMTRVYLGQMVDYAGGDYFFAKPYDARLVVKIIDEVLGEGVGATSHATSGFPTRVIWPTTRCGVSSL